MTEELQCPLITPYTTQLGIRPDMLEKLFVIRKWDTEKGDPIPFSWPATLKKDISGVPFILRQYQVQQAHHLCRMPVFICGDAVGLGKTIDVIVATAWLKERFPEMKVVIVTTKSTTWQWFEEFQRFTTLTPYVVQDNYKGLSSYDARYAQLMAFLEGQKVDVCIIKYTSMIGKRRKIEGKFDEDGNPVEGKERISTEIKNFGKIFKKHRKNIIVAFDEAHRFSSKGTQSRTLMQVLSMYSGKTWALTATAIKNGLDEFYALATAIGLEPLGTLGDFYEEFCVFRDQWMGTMSKPVLMGYKNVPRFRAAIRPFFLGRSQAQVKEKMPKLTTVYHPLDLDERQMEILTDELPNGTIQLPPTIIKIAGEIFEKERDPDNMMTQMSVQQLVANHWCLLDPRDEKNYLTKILSPKEECLLDLLDGDLRGEKVIVYTKYKTWIDRLERITAAGHFTQRKFLRITGNESEKQRNVNKQLFQDPNSGYDLIVINAAGQEGINLQTAAHMVMMDLPWSWGSLIQLVGRMVRMASPNSACTLHVFVAKGTIDEYTVETLKGKKGVFETILGASHSAGILADNTDLDLDSGLEAAGNDEEFLALMRAHVKSTSMSDFLTGEKITASKDNEDYQMSFEKKPSKSRQKKVFNIDDFADKW